ncbi:MAG: hypothetical protein M3457_14515 [Chloroflexota bacterium]|nr:hypothetical protein [Chloroflexota bacterium]
MDAGLYTYAWDLEDEGYDRAVGRIAEAGFTAVNLATSYHAGKFILPHNPRCKVYFAEDGALYFQPDLSKYGRLQPRVSSFVSADGSPVTRLQESAARHGLSYVAWAVCLHNSWLGERYPDTTMHTAFGDPLIHSLSPAHPNVREYLLAMVGDLVARHEAAAIELESPGYMGFTHGYHHEIFGVVVDPVQEELLGISFNPVEIAGATEAGIDAEGLRRRVAALIDACWNRGVAGQVDGQPTAEVRALFDDAEFVAYRAWLHEQVVSLSGEIREVIRHTSPATRIRHFAAMATGDNTGIDAGLLNTGDAVLAGYAATPDDVATRMAALAAVDQPIWGMIRVIAPEVVEPEAIAPLVDAWRAAGVDGIDVYNYGLMPERIFRALGARLNG